MDGEHVIRRDEHTWQAIPTVADLDRLADEIRVLRDELNDARLTGFLAEALLQRAGPGPQ